MTQTPSEKTGACREFLRNLYHFQAGELPRAERESCSEHARVCPPCARRLAVEDGFLQGLRSRLERTPAPPGLRDRVRASLEQQAPAHGGGWLRLQWALPAAAALVLAALLWSVAPGGVVNVSQEVVVVDMVCDGKGATLDQQRLCPSPHHLNALKTSSDRYWNVSLDQESARMLVTDREMRGRRLHVEGELYTAINTLHLTRFSDRGTGLSAQLLPASILAVADH